MTSRQLLSNGSQMENQMKQGGESHRVPSAPVSSLKRKKDFYYSFQENTTFEFMPIDG